MTARFRTTTAVLAHPNSLLNLMERLVLQRRECPEFG
jgi:hypothetical protein